MSISPQPSGPTVVSPLTNALSPTNTVVTPGGGTGHSNSQLAEMLTASFREVEALRHELVLTRNRAEKAEKILNIIQSGSDASNPQQQMPEAAVRTIAECEHRVNLAEQARDEAEARRRVLLEHWTELDRYLSVIEIRAADARVSYSRIVAEGGGQLVLATLPSSQALHNTPNPGVLAMPPPHHPSRHHSSGHTRSHSQRSALAHSSQAWPTLPPLPNPNASGQSRVRPRAGSLDDAGYHVGAGQPPAKRSRGDRDRERDGERDRRVREERGTLSESHQQHPHLPRSKELDYEARERDEFNRGRMSRPSRSMDGTSAQFSSRSANVSQVSRPRGRSRSYSPRSPSQDSAGSQDIDEMLLEATTDSRRHLARSPRQSSIHVHGPSHRSQQHEYHMSFRADSPSSEYRGHLHSQLYPNPRPRGTASLPHLDSHSPGSGLPGASVMSGATMQPDPSGPLPQPGQVQTYQTHIFAPPVTGAPVKKSKFATGSTTSTAGAAGAANNASGGGNAQAQGSNGNSIVPGPPLVATSGSYPAQNAQGQRICRQCGLPGRYKDGKCVEKWGPGPEGPGTVCDRCRKKMKRVERRGTLDSQLTNNSMGSVPPHPSGVSTHGAHHSHSGLIARSLQHSLSSSERPVHRTDTIPINHSTSSRSGGALGPAGTHLVSPPNSFATQDRYRDDSHGHQSPPTPPATATLAVTGEEALDTKRGSVRGVNHSSRHDSVDNRSSPANGVSGRSQSSTGSAPPIAVDSNDATLRRSPPGADHSMTIVPKLASPPAMDLDVDADADPDADADADPDADVDDAELELLEAVDAAEANSSSSDARPKTPEDDVA